jgi:prohibitin 1
MRSQAFETNEFAANVAKFKRFFFYGVFAFFGLVTSCSSYTTIDPGFRGVVVTLGKPSDVVLTEGFHFKLPFVSSVRHISVRVQKSEDKSEAATKDLQKVTAVLALNWHLDPTKVNELYRSIGDENDVHVRIISPAVSEVLKAATAQMTAEEVLTKRLELKAKIDALLIERLSRYNVIVRDVSLVDLDFTHEFNKAVEEKQIAEQKAKQAEYVAQQATQEAQGAINRAKGEAEAELTLARAKAQAQNLLRTTITRDIIVMEYLKKWDGQLPQVVSGSNGMLFDLGKLKARQTASKSEE